MMFTFKGQTQQSLKHISKKLCNKIQNILAEKVLGSGLTQAVFSFFKDSFLGKYALSSYFD